MGLSEGSPVFLALHGFLWDEPLTDGIAMYLINVKK